MSIFTVFKSYKQKERSNLKTLISVLLYNAKCNSFFLCEIKLLFIEKETEENVIENSTDNLL